MNREIIGIIPARGGSKGVPRKNIRILAGKPLIAYTIEEAKKSKYLGRIMVSTEDDEIAKIAKEYGAEVPFLRPKELARDDTPTLPVLQHAVRYLEEEENYFPEVIVLLQPTSPLRRTEDIEKIIEKLMDSDYDSVITVCKVEHPPHWMYEFKNGRVESFVKGDMFLRRQDAPGLYRINGAGYAIRRDLLMNESKILCENMGGVIMPSERSIDIDTELDFKFVEFYINNQ